MFEPPTSEEPTSEFTTSELATPEPTTSKRKLPEPPPADPLGKRLCELFPYRWQPIVAELPEATQKPLWKTLTDYPLRPRALWRLWQDAAYLVGVRFGLSTRYAVLDIDINSPYHPSNAPEKLRSLRTTLETIGLYRTILIRSSWSGGLHLYIPLPESVPTFDLAVVLKQALETQGFVIQSGTLEIFPNTKSYGNNGKIVEYNAHRLPLQPASGSVLLNNDLQPIGSALSQFLQQWDLAAAGQDMKELQKAIAHHRKQYRPRPTRHENKIEAWQQDLLSEIEEGWTGRGQTNHLLKTIACYGVVFKALSDDVLVEYIKDTAISCPGYQTWCQHQHQLHQRAKDWATAAESYYWPLGTSPKRNKRNIHEVNNIVPINRQRSEDAQERIKQALAELTSQGPLPQTKTARMKAIATVAKCSYSTLRKYEGLWNIESGVIALLEPDSAASTATKEAIAETTESALEEELQAIAYMKGGQLESRFEIDQSSPVRKGEGQGRGEMGFPQTLQPHFVSSLPDAECCCDVSDVIAQVQVQIRRLGWTFEQAQQFIAEKFDGRRRSQLSNDELMLLLYYLVSRKS